VYFSFFFSLPHLVGCGLSVWLLAPRLLFYHHRNQTKSQTKESGEQSAGGQKRPHKRGTQNRGGRRSIGFVYWLYG
jgi:hypothetical protein